MKTYGINRGSVRTLTAFFFTGSVYTGAATLTRATFSGAAAFAGAVAFVSAVASASVQAAPAPVIEGSFTSTQKIQSRVERLERRMDSQVNLITTVDRLQQEIERLVGQIEVLNHELATLKKQQKSLYVDMDGRLSKLEKAGPAASMGSADTMADTVGQAGTPVSPVTPATVAGSQAQSVPISVKPAGTSDVATTLARSAYERAFNLLKQGQYEAAVVSFRAFLESYPSASYADNAQYWIAEANYVQRNYKKALTEFKKVVDKYPSSPKHPDALLKMGYTFVELGQRDRAMATLKALVSTFPNTTAAQLAQKRMDTLR